MISGMSIASNNLRHSGSVFILLRAVRIHMRLRSVDKGRVCEGDGLGQGSVSELINTLGDLEDLPSLTYIQEKAHNDGKLDNKK